MICSPLTGGPNGGRNSEVLCHRALIFCGACSSRPYASSEWMWTLITWLSREICSPLTGGPNGGRNLEVRCHRALILCGACSSRPYASFEWMWTFITRFSREICSPLTGGPSGDVPQKCGVIEYDFMRSVFLSTIRIF